MTDRWTHRHKAKVRGLGSQMEKPQHPMEVHHVYYIDLNKEAEILYTDKQEDRIYRFKEIGLAKVGRSCLYRGATSGEL